MTNIQKMMAAFPTDTSGKWMNVADVENLVAHILDECNSICTHEMICNCNDSKLRIDGIYLVKDRILELRNN